MPIHHTRRHKVLKHIIYVLVGCVMQFERFYRLNHSVVASFAPLHHPGYKPRAFLILGKVCGGNCGTVCPYALPPLSPMLKHLIYALDGLCDAI
jgi:hypothetical protein